MKFHILLLICLAILLFDYSPVWAVYAENIIEHSPQAPDSLSPEVILGPPDAGWDPLEEYVGFTDFEQVSTDIPGYVTIGFGGKMLQDISGNEIIVHLYDWHLGDNYVESFEVLASVDNSNWESLGIATPSEGNEPHVRASVSFDLADMGLDYAYYIKIKNIRNEPLTHEGPDIDAIEYIPEPATILLLGLGGLVLRKRK